MTDKNTELEQEQVFDPLDMNNYKVEKLPKMEKSGFEKWMARLGGALGKASCKYFAVPYFSYAIFVFISSFIVASNP